MTSKFKNLPAAQIDDKFPLQIESRWKRFGENGIKVQLRALLAIFLCLVACPFVNASVIWETDTSTNIGWGDGRFLRDHDRAIVRLQNDDPAKSIGHHYRVDREGDRVRVSTTMRVENLIPGNPPRDTAKLLVTLEGDGNKPISYHPINLLKDQDFKDHEIEIDLPPEAKSIKLSLLLTKSTGTLEASAFRVENLTPTLAVALPPLPETDVSATRERANQHPKGEEEITPKMAEIARMVDVTQSPYGADPTGITDSTAAIQQAINANTLNQGNRTQNWSTGRIRVLYLPDGIYRITAPLMLPQNQRDAAWLIFIGQSRNGVVLKLDDNLARFAQDQKPAAVLSFWEGGPNNVAFWNSVRNLTIDIGSGNPGAVALAYHNNNVGSLRDVTLLSSDPELRGRAGLTVLRDLGGIALFKNVLVHGFDVGVDIENFHPAMVLSNIQVQHQRVVGVRNSQKLLAIEQLTSLNDVPAVMNDGDHGQLVIVDSSLKTTGEAAKSESAINNKSGFLFARGLKVEGYGGEVSEGAKILPEAKEYVIGPIITANEKTPRQSLDLPIKPTPRVAYEPVDKWAIVGGGEAPTDVHIQAAIDSGANTVFLPSENYAINKTIIIRGNVRHLHGGWSQLQPSAAMKQGSAPLLRIETTSHDVLLIECFDGGFKREDPLTDGMLWIQNDSQKTVVLRDTFLGHGSGAYRNRSDEPGDLFIENVAFGGSTPNKEEMHESPAFHFTNQRVWARQINPEGNRPHLLNEGGTLWVLGSKVGEGYGPYLVTKSGGRTEVLGITFNSLGEPKPADSALIVTEDSEVAVVGMERMFGKGTPHPAVVRETHGDVKRELIHPAAGDSPFPTRPQLGQSLAIPLYRSGNSNPSNDSEAP
jgi:hypothetical protein